MNVNTLTELKKMDEVLLRVNTLLGREVRNENVIKTVESLVAVIEQQQQEYITLFQSITEDDAFIQQLQKELALLKGEIYG